MSHINKSELHVPELFRSGEEVTSTPEQANGYDFISHFGQLYESDTSRYGFAVPFLGQGLGRNDRCLYVGTIDTTGDIVAQLGEDRTDVDDALASGALTTHTVHDLFPPPTRDDPEKMVTAFEKLVQTASANGSDVRVVVEMTEILEAVSFRTLITYESRLNNILSDANAIVLGLYDRDRIPAAELRDIIRTHPYIVAENTVCQNVYYTPPEEMSDTESADEQVARMIDTLIHQTETHRQLRKLEQQNERLEAFASSLSHDLRTPLQVAIGRAEMLPDDTEHAESLREALDRIEELIEDSVTSSSP